MRRNGKLILTSLLLAAPVQAADEARDFAKECERVYQVLIFAPAGRCPFRGRL